MATPSPTRLFVGLELPTPVRADLAELAARVAAAAGGHAVPARNLHLTVDFVGVLPPPQVRPLAAAVTAALAGPPIPLRPRALRARPRPATARLVALKFDDVHGLLAPRAAAVRAAVDALTGPRPDARPLWPHVTLVRLPRPAPVHALPDPAVAPVVLVRGALLDSRRVHGGPPEYREVAAVDLRAA